MSKTPLHKFHIPVMGLGYSIDTPIKVAHYGIDSVISIVDDDLIEKMRKVHCKKSGREFIPITIKDEDYRAKRITAYLNLVNEIVKDNFQNLIKSFGKKDGEFEKYISLLREDSEFKIIFNEAVQNLSLSEVKDWAISELKLGQIDVNIMTKVDKANYSKNEQLPIQYNDAHASLRGFANSDLNSSIVLSAGMNPRLYSYFEEFSDFYPNEYGELNKKIILKVSDYRSALIQGKFLAKKGLWVSEYRIESGLNCGGHAFASDGFLLGPILEEFKRNRDALIDINHSIYVEALETKNIPFNGIPLEQKITAQGGVGTSDEQNFLIDKYGIDSVGWGTPFLLVPEVANVDENTLQLLMDAKEDDLYLSKISPLGVPFNSLRGNTKDIEKLKNVLNGKPGSPCPKKFLQLNSEYEGKPICTASRTYQSKKIEELKEQNLTSSEYVNEYEKVIEKSCLCVGLATSTLKNSGAAEKIDGDGVLVCPGPNLAYFSKLQSLKQMVDHIYGRANIIERSDRPNMFIKELTLYKNYVKEKITEVDETLTSSQVKYFSLFFKNIFEGISYYKSLFSQLSVFSENVSERILSELKLNEEAIKELELLVERLMIREQKVAS